MYRIAIGVGVSVTLCGYAFAQPVRLECAAISSGAANNNGLILNVGQPLIGRSQGGGMAVGVGVVHCLAGCAADYNRDGVVDTRDVIAFLNGWSALDPRADCDRNGFVDTRDVICFLNAWTAGC